MKKSILKVFGFAALTALCANVWADVAGLPTAIVTEITDSKTLAGYKEKVVNIDGIEQVDDVSKAESVFELTPNRAWKFECDNDAENAYLQWYADYTVSLNKSIAKNSMGLFGYYGDWAGIGFFAPQEVPAGYKIPLLNYMTKKSNWTYSQIRNLVGTFVCGAFNLSSDNADTTMTVELRLFSPDMTPEDIRDSSKWVENVNTYVVESIDYKLSDVINVPAKAGSWPELEYVGIAPKNESIPVGYYALEGSEFVKLTEPKGVNQPTAYFKPFERTEEIEVEVAEDVKEQTKVIDKNGEERPVSSEEQLEVEQKVEEAVQDIVNNKAVQEKTDTGITAEEILTVTKDGGQFVKDNIKDGLQDAAKDAEQDVKDAVDAALNSRDVTGRISITLEATGVTVEKTTDLVEVTVTKAVFDVNPLATLTVVTGTTEKPETNEFTTVIKNEDLAGKTLTVRLPLPSTFTHNVRVIYKSADPNYPNPEEYLVASQVGPDGKRFCEIQVTHFSTAEAYDTTESIPKKYQSTDVLGIIRRNDSGSSKASYENAIAVPWVSRAANGDIRQGMSVEDFITSNGLGEGDELHVWIPNSKMTHQGTAGGVSVTRKGAYAIFRWNDGAKAWEGAKDMGGGKIAKVGADYLIPRGAAVWYTRASTTTGDYTIVGLVSNACETVVEKGTKSGPVMTLLVNPFPADTVNVAAIQGAEGDELILNPMGSSSETETETYTFSGTSWGHTVSEQKLFGTKTIYIQKFAADSSIEVVPGRSFWYVSRGGQPTINWKAIKVAGSAD